MNTDDHSQNPAEHSWDAFGGKKVIVRTYSAGVFFGTLAAKAGNEVILNDARRLWRWASKEGISLSSVALFGIDQKKSKIEPPVPVHWVVAIEILPCSETAAKSIEDAQNVTAS